MSTEKVPDNLLFKKIHGCIAAGSCGNSMGEIMEGDTVDERIEKFGWVEELLPVTKETHSDTRWNPSDVALGHPLIYHGHVRPAGTTEDGEERYRMLCTAIIEKGGRIDIMDLAKIWVRDIKPDKFGWLVGPQDQVIYYSLKAGVPPWEVGCFASWPGFYGTVKMIGALGIVNACNPAMAAQDAMEVGRIKDRRGVPANYALEICAAHAAAVAEALRPNATIQSVIDTACSHLSKSPLGDVKRALEWAANCDNVEEYGRLFDKEYYNRPVSKADEIFCASMGLLTMSKGNPRDAIILAVNSGRDTDCRAHTAGSLAGALSGIDAVPADWVKTVDNAMKENPYTTSNRTSLETSIGLYNAAVNTINHYKSVIAEFEQQC
jgi:ADP-ribosylglycohydrolase